MRNLVMWCLDGLSQIRFNSVRDIYLRPLQELMHQSIVFRCFHAASTSGFQSFCDLMFGDSSELDHNAEYPSGPGCLRGRNSHFFAILAEQGYATLGAQQGKPCPIWAKDGLWGAWPERCGEFRTFEEKDDLHLAVGETVAGAKAAGKPFALYLSERDLIPGDGTASAEVAQMPGYIGKGLLTKCVNTPNTSLDRLLTTLKDNGVLEDTLIVVFSNHGLDFWTHGFYGGRTHAIDPYADMCWLPLFIYNNGRDAGIYDNLVSMIDLKPTLLSMLLPNLPPEQPKTPFSGMNVFAQKRELAFGQRMFARQFDNRDPYRSMEKSYSVTDGDQRLIVSSGGGKPGKGGMELYYDVRDPSNTRNFLDFFRLDPNGNMVEFGRTDIVHVHFLQSFKPHLVMSIVNAYNTMRPHLFNFVRAKEMAALLDPQKPQGETMPDKVFTHKREKKTGRLY